ncbi:hypothetical protein IGL98_003232 [Enterococcus sp. DIV0840]|uniref:hypothetical protein n=1 Tax=Enterococcus TaxID=1350 RepID=UPI001A8DEC7E|nr:MULTISPECIES: hypothetical protein [Enterococcus]MBO0434832.1 hypothetical protein [Enterococcus sp. DIV0849a]MBO0475255.1 hypothetical protein [Enterococcus ureasiticus]
MKIKLLGVIALSMLCTASLGNQVLADEVADSQLNIKIDPVEEKKTPSLKSIDAIDFGNIKPTIEEQTVTSIGNPQIVIGDAHSAVGFKVVVKMSHELVPGSVLKMGQETSSHDGILTNEIDVNEDYQTFLLGRSEIEGDRTFSINPRLVLPPNVASGNYEGTLNWNIVIAV